MSAFETEYGAKVSDIVKDCPDWIKLGCGDEEYICEEKGSVFPGADCPDALPDLAKHENMCADFFKTDAGKAFYDANKNEKTASGVGLAKCIKTGMDNKGHPNITTCGLVGGDEESWTKFADVFNAVIKARHNGYDPTTQTHPTDMDASKISTTKIDPTGNYVLTSRCRTGRSVAGFNLPPACGFQERRDLEKLVVGALEKLDGELKGEYFGLHGSKSLPDKMMSKEKEEELRSNGNLFQEPDSTLLLSSGCGRHWPDARGIYHNTEKNFFVWMNEEDHMRIISMEKGDNIKAIFDRFAAATAGVQKVLTEAGKSFMRSDNLGWILSCPSNLGTGLRAGAIIKIPLFSARADFKAVLGKMKLQARGTAGVDSVSNDGRFDISNSDRLGTSEVDLVNIFIEGVAQIIRWEQALEAKSDIEADIAAAKPLGV